MISQQHKYLLAGVVVGILAYWAWSRRASGEAPSEGV